MMQSLMGQQCRQQLLEFETNRLIVSFSMPIVRNIGNTTKPVQLDQKPLGGSDTLNFCLCDTKKLADFSCFCHWCSVSTFPAVEATIIYPGPAYDYMIFPRDTRHRVKDHGSSSAGGSGTVLRVGIRWLSSAPRSRRLNSAICFSYSLTNSSPNMCGNCPESRCVMIG